MSERVEEVIVGWPGLMVHCGLGTPTARGIAAAAVAGGVAYAAKWPRQAFDREGRMRPLTSLSASPHAVDPLNHFLLTPVVAGGLFALCT